MLEVLSKYGHEEEVISEINLLLHTDRLVERLPHLSPVPLVYPTGPAASCVLLRDWGGEEVWDCYLAVDCEPAPLWELMAWLGEQLGVTLREGEQESARGARRSRRMSNRRLLDSGYVFRYPDYRSGYRELLAAGEI